MSERNDRQYQQRKAARREKLKRERLRRKRRRVMIGTLMVLILLVTVPYMAVTAIRGQVFIQDVTASPTETAQTAESTEAAESTETTGSTEKTTSAVTEVSNWDYTTDETMPSADIVDMTSAFYTYDTMCRDLYFLQQRYGQYMSVNVFGKSLDDRDLLDCVVGSSTAEKDIIIQYAMHGREYIVVNLAMKQLEDLLKSYETGSVDGVSLTDIFSKVRLHIIPMMNPDGVTISQEGFEAIRNEELRSNLYKIYDDDKALGKGSENIDEYTSTWKANARAVDLNRNFATDGWTTEMGTQQPSCSRYPGTGPNSEPEVKALIDLTESINCVAQIAYHVHGRIVYDDYGMQSTDPALYEKDKALSECIAALTVTDSLPAYSVISTVQDGQNPGGCSDYFMQIKHIPAVTVECGNKFKDDGSYNDAPLSLDQIQGIYDENDEILSGVAALIAAES